MTESNVFTVESCPVTCRCIQCGRAAMGASAVVFKAGKKFHGAMGQPAGWMLVDDGNGDMREVCGNECLRKYVEGFHS